MRTPGEEGYTHPTLHRTILCSSRKWISFGDRSQRSEGVKSQPELVRARPGIVRSQPGMDSLVSGKARLRPGMARSLPDTDSLAPGKARFWLGPGRARLWPGRGRARSWSGQGSSQQPEKVGLMLGKAKPQPDPDKIRLFIWWRQIQSKC